jgi:hypothetical protein
MNDINQSDIESSLGTEKSKPIVDALQNIAQVLNNQQPAITTLTINIG